MAGKRAGFQWNSLVLGVCLPSLRHDASKFKVQRFIFDKYLKKHFRSSVKIFAHDPDKICKTGDIALIEKLPNSNFKPLKFKVLEVMYSFGDITDPITGKKVVAGMLREDLETINSFYGKIDSGFDYYKAPYRGWQEDKRDFSHREAYIKYHEFDEDDENKDQPYAIYT